ncbi:DUF202 domain-containing protein [Brevibacterium daeguense]|uniref:DUF202 domain-containing protein n=1 Tax=Brevibacterium daeguense TaxID=909936 RepID=A0ABP8EJ31_9MICO|nr:DUF202 domain-containing protein [Brevibacterium daeguense]
MTRLHSDPGLQPERTALSWARTTVAFLVTSAIFLRWLPHYGLLSLVPTMLAAVAALAIYLPQRRRYAQHSRELEHGGLQADPVAVIWMTAVPVVLGACGLVLMASALSEQLSRMR